MNNRIAQLRKNKGWTQDTFAEEMGISKNYVSLIENGKKIPSDRLVSDICREFGVNEKWLRDGTGDMYDVPDDEIASVVSELLEEDNPFYELIIGIMKTYQGLDDKSQELLKNLGKQLLDNLKKRD